MLRLVARYYFVIKIAKHYASQVVRRIRIPKHEGIIKIKMVFGKLYHLSWTVDKCYGKQNNFVKIL